MNRLAHIVNPVLVNPSSDLFVAQPITFETMRVARDFCLGHVDVELFSAQYPEDHPVVPTGFHRTPDLEQSVLDYGQFQRHRKLPLLKDILDRLFQATSADYLIYTNVDIALLPHFYAAIDQFIRAGHDAFVVNRRTIAAKYAGLEQIPLMYADVGQPHRGWDCFVFRRDAYPGYNLGTICVGAPHVGLALIANLVAHASSFREMRFEHLTFHIGDDRSWRRGSYTDYAEHNSQEALRILADLEERHGAFDRSSPPGAFLLKTRTLGPLYKLWMRYAGLPLGLRRSLEGLQR